jgi:hypothetical protein
VVVKKSSVENRQSSSGFPSEQLVESWEEGAVSSVRSPAVKRTLYVCYSAVASEACNSVRMLSLVC